jgi:hypothetical protein
MPAEGPRAQPEGVALSDIDETTPDTGNSVDHQTTTPNGGDTNWEQRYKDTQGSYTKSQQELAAERGVWEDEQAALARLAEKFPHLFEDGDDDEDDADEEIVERDEDRPLTRAEFKQWQDEQAQQSKAQTAAQQFEADFEKFKNGRDLDKWDDKAIRHAVSQGEIKTPEDLKAAVDEVLSRHGKQRPRVPHTPTTGQAATQVPDYSKMSRGDINKAMVEQVLANEAQT